MNQARMIINILRPVLPVLFTIAGALGSLYTLGTGAGSKVLTAFFLLVFLSGISLIAYDETRKNDFFEAHFGGKLSGGKSGSKKRRRSGKRCPHCEKVIYHKRTTCQHCGYEFPSKQYEEAKKEKEGETLRDKERI